MSVRMLALAAILALSQATALAQPIAIKYSHGVADQTPTGQAALRFKELAEKALPGQVEVHVFPNSHLFGDGKEMDALLVGDVQIIAPPLAKFGKFTKQLQVFELPFLFDDIAAVERFQAGPRGQALLDSMSKKGIKGLGYLRLGMKQMTANKALKQPADGRGLKFRIQASDVAAEQFKAVGAQARKLAAGEVYQALQTGAVDGTESSWTTLHSQRFHEVRKFVTESDHGVLGSMVIANSGWWSRLPPGVRAALSQAMVESIHHGNRTAFDEAAAHRQKVIDDKRAEVVTLSQDERKAWREAMKPVWRKWEKDIGKDLIDAAQKANKS